MRISGLRIAAIASAVPQLNTNCGDAKSANHPDTDRLAKATGVKARRVASAGLCTSDLCYEAAQRALAAAEWQSTSIDALIFVTQTPDYILPATSCILHSRMGMRTSCAAFDVNQGCAGYVYGLWIAASLINAGAERVALLAGDTVTKLTSNSDFATAHLFGDAGSATLLEKSTLQRPWSFVLGTDGGGAEHIIVEKGGCRVPHNGKLDSSSSLAMNGAEVFSFTLAAVPSLYQAVLAEQGWDGEAVHSIVMHQANSFMLNHLRNKIGARPDQLPTSLSEFGNTSSASIPLTICSQLGSRLERSELQAVLLGFGVGFSWAGAALSIGPFRCPPIAEVTEQMRHDCTSI